MCAHLIDDTGTLPCVRTTNHVAGHGCVYEASAGPDLGGDE